MRACISLANAESERPVDQNPASCEVLQTLLGELEPDLLKRLAVSMKKRIQMVLDAAGKAIDR